MMRTTLCQLFMLLIAVSASSQTRWIGGDISLLPSYEERGTVYRDAEGKAVSLLPFLTNEGWNAFRVRLFVNPEYAPQKHKDEGVCQDLDYALQLSRRIKATGAHLLLDLHYSDYWADPAKQAMPHVWLSTKAADLPDSVYQYTVRVLRAFKQADATPDAIQVGNEISFGMLWPTGRIVPQQDDNWDVLLSLLGQGCRACREECPGARIVIHTERAGQWEVTKAYYDHLRRYRLDYDIIGLSYYPMWHGSLQTLGNTLDSLSTRFPDKDVMIVETAAYYSHKNDTWAKSPDQYSEFFPISPDGQQHFTQQLMQELNRHPCVKGVFWWFPEENACGNNLLPCWINRGLFDNDTGRALPALQSFKW